MAADKSNSVRMTLGEHFEELRQCLFRAVIGIAVGMGICLLFGDHLMKWICWPAAVAMKDKGLAIHLRALAPAEAFTTYLKVTLIVGAIVAAPYSLYQLWKFIAAGLYPHERRYVTRSVPFSVALFGLGVTFFFLFIAPMCLKYFFGFAQDKFPQPPTINMLSRLGESITGSQPATTQPTTQPAAWTSSEQATQPVAAPLHLPLLQNDPPSPAEGQMWVNAADGRIRYFLHGQVQAIDPAETTFLASEIRLSDYMTFIALMSLAFGLGFQVPILVLVLTRTGIMSIERLSMYRKYVLLIILIVAAVLTPPDMWSQIALAIPMYLLYELGLLLARISRRRRQARREE